MKIIGITGKSGVGKTTLSNMLSSKLNCKTIDIDKIGHEAIRNSKIINELCLNFGEDILEKNRMLNQQCKQLKRNYESKTCGGRNRDHGGT